MQTKVIELTPHQSEIKAQIDWQLSQGLTRIVLTGSAGVGKTTLVNFLISEYLERPGLVYVTAPTHKALSVLQKKVAHESHKLEFNTVHKGLKLRMKINEKTGKKEFVQQHSHKDKPFRSCSLLVIDEASMLSQFLLDLLKQYHFPIIFIGDEKQVNPVDEEHSPVFHQNWFTTELTEIIRQGEGNPIIDLSRNLPAIFKKEDNLILHENGDRTGYLYSYDRSKVIHKLAEVNGTDDLKYLAWTNAEVDAINYSVRTLIYGNPALLEEGESIVLNSAYVVRTSEEILQNNEELRIESLEVLQKAFWCGDSKFDYLVYQINGEGIYVIHEDFIPMHKNNVRAMKAMAINKAITWREYYAFSDYFLDFKYNHAITVHKSQGSTYKDVVVNIKDIARNRKEIEKRRLLYTAVTRASNLLILYNV